MPYEPRSDQLSRDELEGLQRGALREWRESEWLATNDPRAWTALESQDPTRIMVDLGGGVGESQQCPGYICLDRTGQYVPIRDLEEKTGETRRPDVTWDMNQGLPFEDQAVDVYHLRRVLRELSAHAMSRLPKELARTLGVGGIVHVMDAAPLVRRLGNMLEEQGFELESLGHDPDGDSEAFRGRFVLARQKRALEDVQPHAVEDTVMGDLRIREPRQPYRR